VEFGCSRVLGVLGCALLGVMGSEELHGGSLLSSVRRGDVFELLVRRAIVVYGEERDRARSHARSFPLLAGACLLTRHLVLEEGCTCRLVGSWRIVT